MHPSQASSTPGGRGAGTGPRRIDPDRVRSAELRAILGEAFDGSPKDVEAWGLALSGGGIRSATFGLGVLQALASLGLLRCFHYQSTVSGGGYIGAFLQGLIYRKGFDRALATLGAQPDEDIGPTAASASATPRAQDAVSARDPIRHLREYSNYLSPHKASLSGDTLGVFGTYVRNVILIQLQLCALILAATLLPLAAYALLSNAMPHPGALVSAAAWMLVLATACLAYVSTASDRRGTADAVARARRWVPRASKATIALFAAASLVGAIGLAGYERLPRPLDRLSGLAHLPPSPSWRLGVATACLYLLLWLGWMAAAAVYLRWRGADDAETAPRRHLPRFLGASVLAAAFAGLAAAWVQAVLSRMGAAGDGALLQVMVAGPSLLCLGLVAIGIVHIGLAGPALSDLQREIWARVGGKSTALVIAGISLTLAITVYGPWAIVHLKDRGWNWASGLGGAGVLAWISTTGVGLLAGFRRSEGTGNTKRSRLLDLVVRIAPWVFILGLLVLLSLAGQSLLGRFGAPLQAWSSASTTVPADLAACRASVATTASAGTGTGLAAAPARPAAGWRQDLHDHLACLDARVGAWPRGMALLLLAALAIWGLFSAAVDVNEYSLNAFYRNRLVRCYLGAVNDDRNPEPTTNFDVRDDLLLGDLLSAATRRADGTRPLFPLVCTALNLVAAKQLDWQDRKAASFCFSPGYCGYLPPDSRPGEPAVGDRQAAVAATARAGAAQPGQAHGASVQPIAAGMRLGAAMAISGAAVNPNMGYHSSPAVTFLLTLFDARLGWWLRNPNHDGGEDPGDVPLGGLLLAELLGQTDGGGKFVHLSDGGHFENLGLYELVRRRCRFVLCVDAAADPRRAFADLGNAVHKCRVDFGAAIDIDVADLRPEADGRSARCCALGRITYADGSPGTLLYLKPTLTGSEPADILHYASAHPGFPHESTADQYFDEAQFESYRRLGECIARQALQGSLDRVAGNPQLKLRKSLTVLDSVSKSKLVHALQQRWVAPPPGAAGRFATHGSLFAEIFGKLRGTPSLATLDAQLYPAWSDLAAAAGPTAAAAAQAPGAAATDTATADATSGATSGAGADPATDPGTAAATGAGTPARQRLRLPAPEHFRDCFYFCQELIQRMEAAYHDFDLENAWNHPDNRGWMNAFRQWAGVPMFRVAWVLGAPTFGARFVAFCEQRLELPRLDEDLRQQRLLVVRDASPPSGAAWNDHCRNLARQGMINHLEHGVLASDPMRDLPAGRAKLLLLRLKWSDVAGPASTEVLPESTVGVAVLAGRTLRLLRIQNHLRKLGLSRMFMWLLLGTYGMDPKVEIRSGFYGSGGICSNRKARQTAEILDKLLQQALKRKRDESAAEKRERAWLARRAAARPAAGAGQGSGTAALGGETPRSSNDSTAT